MWRLAIGEETRRASVGLGEDDIEGDRRGAGIADPLGQLGKVGARPGPLAEAPYALVVNVDDPDAGIPERPGREALIGVEDEAAGLVEGGRHGELRQRHEQYRQEPGENDRDAARGRGCPLAPYAQHPGSPLPRPAHSRGRNEVAERVSE